MPPSLQESGSLRGSGGPVHPLAPADSHFAERFLVFDEDDSSVRIARGKFLAQIFIRTFAGSVAQGAGRRFIRREWPRQDGCQENFARPLPAQQICKDAVETLDGRLGYSVNFLLCL